KVKRTAPWTYLGMKIHDQTIVPQQIKIMDNPRNLAELHQLCGQIEWIRPYLGVSTEALAPLFNLLKGKGDRDLSSPRILTPEVREAIKKVEFALETRQSHRFDPKLPFKLAVIGHMLHFSGLIHQWDESQTDHLLIIEWVFLSNSPDKSITTPQDRVARLVAKARSHLATLAGWDFTCMYLPFSNDQLDEILQNNVELQCALDSYSGQTSCHYPQHKVFGLEMKIVRDPVQSKEPLKALTLFTDGSGKSGKSVIAWQDPSILKWESDVERVSGSPQVAELAAVVRAFDRFREPFNLVTDSAYVAGVVSRAENAWVSEHGNSKIRALLVKLVELISHRKQPYYVLHVRSHTNHPGF
ncbi:POK18 protein, partial [Pachycephala philippinensis]|nr:POK18 protein [Pachycephala philippinensis]